MPMLRLHDSDDNSLATRLAANLPAAVYHAFKYHHISTPPNLCPALYAPPPGFKPEKTYCESHFLLVSEPAGTKCTPVFAVEALIYTTATLTTIFVSKADSTGLASPANRPATGPSPSKVFTSTFVSHLASHRHRPDRQLVVSLFARAQGQYLFPGSVEHGKKNVLDDRQLVRWWCQTLDTVLREYAGENEESGYTGKRVTIRSKAYLIVPGQDKHETANFFPHSARKDAAGNKRWVDDHPLRRLTPFPSAPPRSQVPHFPDDPKSRFLDDLDEELPDVPSSQTSQLESPSKRGTGQWKSVKTLEQFWDMMAFRQECCSGRLVGFLWIVLRPQTESIHRLDKVPLPPPLRPQGTPERSQPSRKKSPRQLPLDRRKDDRRRCLSGPVIPRPPRVKSAITFAKLEKSQPEMTEYYYWPKSSRGSVVLPHKAYARSNELLLRLDFASSEVAHNSMIKWINEVGVMGEASGQDWGVLVRGTCDPGSKTAASENAENPGAKSLATKRKHQDDLGNGERKCYPGLHDHGVNGQVNTLDVGLLRKKRKVEGTFDQSMPPTENGVNMLEEDLIKKKVKA